jgi:hypothetical protein
LGKNSQTELPCRVDIARNCLNAGLWEVFLYTQENQQELPYYHGWFVIPKNIYRPLFEKINDISFKTFAEPFKNWVNPEIKEVNLNVLRRSI